MLWPTELKDKVRETAGKRGITEFTIKAVGIHLGVDEDLTLVEKELNEVKHFAQRLADMAVMGGTAEERLQALMEVEFPSWVDTTGWPAPAAERVRPEPLEPKVDLSLEVPTGLLPGDPIAVSKPETPPPAVEPEPEPGEVTTPVPEPSPNIEVQAPVQAPVSSPIPVDRDDLFAKVMAKTGGKLADVPGLTVASAVEVPEKPPVDPDSSALCPTCKEELVDGECWTCS